MLAFEGTLIYCSISYRIVSYRRRESVRPSQAGIALKPLNTESLKQRHTIAQGL